MAKTNLRGLVLSLMYHLDWTKMIGFVENSKARADIKYRGEYLEENALQINQALMKIESIANEKGYSDIKNVLDRGYEDGWKCP
jgi:hypothetical protein